MTIAACYLSSEGVVLGADSTTTLSLPNNPQFFNNNQKIFEVGCPGSVGIATWGLGGLGDVSLRTVIAEFADTLASKPMATITDVANAWCQFVWTAYDGSSLLQGYRALAAKENRNDAEEKAFQQMNESFGLGFYIGGCGKNRKPGAYSIQLLPTMTKAPPPNAIAMAGLSWAGVPNIASRVIKGYDENLKVGILASGKWSGSEAELVQILDEQNLNPGTILPIRDAVDYVYSCIFGTIKAMKFSQLPSTCGGSIEVAVMTSDRDFRWVKHKSWSTGIEEVM